MKQNTTCGCTQVFTSYCAAPGVRRRLGAPRPGAKAPTCSPLVGFTYEKATLGVEQHVVGVGDATASALGRCGRGRLQFTRHTRLGGCEDLQARDMAVTGFVPG